MLNYLLAHALPVVPKPVVKEFAKRYVAGDTMEDMVETVKQLNQLGISATVDLLGEFIERPQEALETADMYRQILDTIQAERLNANVSVKLTAMGLLVDPALCFRLMRGLADQATRLQNFIRIDMEDSECTDKTIDLYLDLRRSYSNIGIVLQAYLRRTHNDVLRVSEADAGNFRLCKGIYIEPRQIAYQLADLINLNYVDLLKTMIERGAYVGIATHDERLVWHALKLIRKFGLKRDQYEFQMLLGVDPPLRDMLVASGHHVRVYVPFGSQWHGYCMRRLKENPKIAGYILQNLLH
jgi:proline dehydrogenase